jgi:hypothetical protein
LRIEGVEWSAQRIPTAVKLGFPDDRGEENVSKKLKIREKMKEIKKERGKNENKMNKGT